MKKYLVNRSLFLERFVTTHDDLIGTRSIPTNVLLGKSLAASSNLLNHLSPNDIELDVSLQLTSYRFRHLYRGISLRNRSSGPGQGAADSLPPHLEACCVVDLWSGHHNSNGTIQIGCKPRRLSSCASAGESRRYACSVIFERVVSMSRLSWVEVSWTKLMAHDVKLKRHR